MTISFEVSNASTEEALILHISTINAIIWSHLPVPVSSLQNVLHPEIEEDSQVSTLHSRPSEQIPEESHNHSYCHRCQVEHWAMTVCASCTSM